MRRWLRVLVVGVLTVLLSIDSASACRFLRSRCRPRCRVVTCRVVRHTSHHCVPCDGSAHAVIIESSPVADAAPVVEYEHTPAPQPAAPAVVEAPVPAVPQPIKEPLQPLEPIAPVSAEKPLVPAAEPATPPAPQPQFKSAAEILAESAEQERIEKAAAEAAKPAVPAAEPPMTKAPVEPAEPPTPIEEPKPPVEPEPKNPAPAPAVEEPAEPAPEPAQRKPAPKPAEENLFDEADDEPAADEPAAEKPAPMKKAPTEEPVEDLFGEPEATKPAEEKAPAAKESTEEAPADEKTEKAEDDPFALLDTSPEPVRRWVDATGRHETIGRLVEVHPDRIRILKSNGRFTTVLMERLSRHDQSYVTQVGERIAAKRPAVTDTAQR